MGDRNDGLGPWIDIFRVREYFDVITQVREIARRTRADRRFIGALRRSLVKLPGEDGHRGGVAKLWTRPIGSVPLRRTRLGVMASGGSGALASLVGVLKACEELGVQPAAMSFASGAALFGFPIAAGKSPDEVAEFVLSFDPGAWIDPDWLGMATILPKRGRGFAGILRGDRLERSYAELLGKATLGDLAIPSYVPVWNIEHNTLEYVGPKTHPELSVAKAIRMAVSLPLFFDPVRWRGGSWCDGAIVDIFPVHPLLDIEPPCDSVLAVNCFYPPEFRGDNAAGWSARTWSVLDIADQVATCQHVELARENLRRLRAEVPSVMMIDPVPYGVVRRTGFYTQFLDHSSWPEFMRSGRRAAATALIGHLARPGARPGSRSHRMRRSA